MQQSTALFFLSGFSHKKNECDEQVLKTCRLVDTMYHRLMTKQNVIHTCLLLETEFAQPQTCFALLN